MPIAFHPRVWLNFVRSPLYSVEHQILTAAASAETGSTRRVIEAQIAAINFVQRHGRGREVFFYRIAFGLVRASRGVPIELPQREFLWAEVQVDFRRVSFCASEVWMLNGRVSCLTFDREMGRSQLDRSDATVKLIRFHAVTASQSARPAWVDRLPSDLGELAAMTSGVGRKLTFVQPEEAYEVTLPEGRFVVVGELVDGGNVLVPSSDNKSYSGVYFASYGGSPVRYLGEDCRAAMRVLGDT